LATGTALVGTGLPTGTTIASGSGNSYVITYTGPVEVSNVSVSAVNGASISVPASPNNNVAGVAGVISGLGWDYITANVTATTNILSIFSSNPSYSGNNAGAIYLYNGSGTVLTNLGFSKGRAGQPEFYYGTSAEQPLWQTSQSEPRPSKSVWIKVGESGNGLNPRISQWNNTAAAWLSKNISFAKSDWNVIKNLDSTGGAAIPAGTIYAQYAYDNQTQLGPLQYWYRYATGPTNVIGLVNGLAINTPITNAETTLNVQASKSGSNDLTAYTVNIIANTTPAQFITAWSNANIPETQVSLTDSGNIQISHLKGGVIILNDYNSSGTSSGFLTAIGFQLESGLVLGTDGVKEGSGVAITYAGLTSSRTVAVTTPATFNITTLLGNYSVTLVSGGGGAGSAGYAVGDVLTFASLTTLSLRVTAVGTGGSIADFVIDEATTPTASLYSLQLSNWREIVGMVANEGAPVNVPQTGRNWYYSVIDEVDIMVKISTGWVGYGNSFYDEHGFPSVSGGNTDPNGPIISASEPLKQSTGTDLVYGDLWLDTSNLDEYPLLNRYENIAPAGQPVIKSWVRIDNTDQTSPKGVLFADARWATNGTTNPANDPIPTIKSLLKSNYIDIDAPEDAQYPVGMLLFNTRRSGYNVKQYRRNYFNAISFPDKTYPLQTDAWVSVSGLKSDGSPYMGRKAQRAIIVKSLKTVIDNNQGIRDDDNFFNLIACPGYPELQPNMIALNNERKQTGFIIGDTPFRLNVNATDIQAWATNAKGATSTGEDGLVSRDSYLGIFYPSGVSNDLSGNQIIVPSSHMMIRTILNSDIKSYPWFAPAGTRRGNIDNATNIGTIDAKTGEFNTNKVPESIRNVLQEFQINPMAFFTGTGLVNFGQKTSFASQSALDRINVARLTAFLKRQLALTVRPFIFEQNDSQTRNQIAAIVQTIFNELIAKRAIYDYYVDVSEQNNTPARIDRNELWVDCGFQPVKSVEFIYVPVRILNTGETV
jgi:hypothetical protein